MTDKRKAHLQKKHSDLLREILTRFLGPDVEVHLFGSRAQGQANRASDLDLLLKAEQPIPLATISRIRAECEQSDLPFKVDISDFRRISKEFAEQISPSLIPLFSPSRQNPRDPQR